MNARASRAAMTIGDVLALLRADFPDVTISKIRFLETEGLIEPQRSPSGYRKFGPADVDRLRFILSAQRDQYLPLRVIKERLQEADRGADPVRAPRTLVAADTDAPGPPVRLTRRQLLDGAGIEEVLLAQLEEFGLVRRSGVYYEGEALTVARAAAALGAFGFEARHLRAVKAAADREVGLIEQVVAPLLRRRNPGAHERAADTARRLAELSLELHAALVAAGLRESLDH
ncbi:MerR family transcriptional regulator [Actinomadura craniellae]|uniref:MerR family transcriptional regulator n=1 Tax=Actinomadura craniellae TaxID=2231787 RepID=A0A365GWI7_9ACTN|nr:MerR family transcriptional regulator [Actinomadura craniellae]RAY11179.1 MerR family transcriptional regulator [Actinomadura craniellae]